MHSDIARQPPPRAWSLVEPDTVTIAIDGKEIEAQKGMLLIEAAERADIYIPRFCWHNRMQPVAMCRMCIVEVDGVRGLPPSCTTPVADVRPPDKREEPGPVMTVRTQSDTIRRCQDGILEFLLINHPLDCPVCDKGGECPLQDQTLYYGPGESRFVEEKRHFEKPIEISDLVLLDRERCILCARCTRFTEEISGDPLIDFVERGTDTQVLTFPDAPFRQYFSGNTVQLCPVGALTASTYRFRARPWDLEVSESTCTTCAVGCRVELHSSANRMLRLVGVDSEPVNQSWLCDKGRFLFEHLSSADRVITPRTRLAVTAATAATAADWEETTWPVALDLVTERLAAAGTSVAILGGARGTNESAYMLARLGRDVMGTDLIDCQLDDGLPAAFVTGVAEGVRARIDDLETAACVVVIGIDLKEELPVLYLRVRRAATALRTPLVEINARGTGLTRHATHAPPVLPGATAAYLSDLAGEHAAAGSEDIHALLRSGPVVVIVGRGNLAEDPSPVAAAAAALVNALPDAKLWPALRRGNVHGALECGATSRSAARTATHILEEAAAGRVDVLVLAGCDPVRDYPFGDLAERALDKVPFVAALDLFVTESTRYADVLLPATATAETDGTTTSIEGRVSRLNARVTAPGTARPDWSILQELAERLRATGFPDSGWEAIAAEMTSTLPAWSGIRPTRLGRGPAVDGAVTIAGARADGETETFAAALTTEVPPVDAYSLRLVSSRTLYDGGTMQSHAPALAAQTPPAVVSLARRDADRLGVDAGTEVAVRSKTGTVVLPVAVDAATPEGVAWVPFPHARPLLEAGALYIEVRVETLGASERGSS